jgi:cytochrome c oxidase subunit 3
MTIIEQKNKVLKPLLWISMVSMAMVFAGLTSAYVVRKAEGNWLDFDFPIWFYISTVFILISSFTIREAKKLVVLDQQEKALKWIKMTFGLGLSFAISQLLTWSSLYDLGVYFTGPGSNASGSFWYILTLFHLLHVLAGMIVLSFGWYKVSNLKYNNTNSIGFELVTIFWHFLDFLWLYLFCFLLLIR